MASDPCDRAYETRGTAPGGPQLHWCGRAVEDVAKETPAQQSPFEQAESKLKLQQLVFLFLGNALSFGFDCFCSTFRQKKSVRYF